MRNGRPNTARQAEMVLRGPRPQGPPINVLVRYPTYEQAVEAYESDEYQAIVGIAKESANRMLTILEVDD